METAGRERRPVPPRSSSDDDDLFLPHYAGARGAAVWARQRSRDFGSVSSEDYAAWSPEPRDESDVNKYGAARVDRMRVERQGSIVDGLLFEIYDRWHGRERDSLDSDTFTECSSTSEIFGARADSYQAVVGRRHARQLNRGYLQGLSEYRNSFLLKCECVSFRFGTSEQWRFAFEALVRARYGTRKLEKVWSPRVVSPDQVINRLARERSAGQ